MALLDGAAQSESRQFFDPSGGEACPATPASMPRATPATKTVVVTREAAVRMAEVESDLPACRGTGAEEPAAQVPAAAMRKDLQAAARLGAAIKVRIRAEAAEPVPLP